MQDKKIRIQDVAAMAGVSVGSASRVLNQAANVSPDVRAKVEHAMAQLEYQPSHTARALRSRSSRTIGCMFSDITNPLYARAFRVLEDAFRADGYMLLLAHGLNDVERELESLRTFQARGMDGVICAPGHERAPELVALMNSMSMPIVLYDREMPDTRADALLFDHVRGMKDACNQLFAFGHERIALALWNAGSRPVRKRIEGYKAAYRAAGMEPPDLILRQPTPTSSVYEDLLRMLEGPAPPTALIAQGTHILVSALRAVARTGRRVPQDFSVVSIGDSDFTQTHDPPITALRTDAELVAAHAKALLLDRLSGRVQIVAPPRAVVAPYDLIERASWATRR
ncbi:LacI family DNA-binding transcriptional regulator [Verminephrobacter eiseniae]|uniref:LacI family DNA-binding transcriptional regulator n=1 Tax=Verminephrobacter eiseniae TaxID=364317 RepID=UPI002237BBCB|nr:substrate-binding domain-containing protein [Verminephrobacter eiseniae]MCW5230169.1 LacI family DNA-binding transcriptional regulator [Verminephrobacter eiseniae]MCW5232303.1 LacI family DNA-binding transcriptional regulator [Verminephrobacter eiseniae]MCW5291901.1 LacI family DNA-binding transcriptional regulator [Verminephrobacter eiseniae]MCW5296134.1 LacI family DNA-binding transcriptional regulator [Verminephrobacter eiseniae]MCW8187776.1 LacI family DNA-binding transcriptional regula